MSTLSNKNIFNWSEEEIEKRSSEFQDEISPIYYVKSENQSWEDFNLEMAIKGSYEFQNIFGWSHKEVLRRSREFQDSISPMYYARKCNESWRQFHFRMAKMSLDHK
jgi:hypothetical protein